MKYTNHTMTKIDSRFYDLTAVLNYTAEDTEADASKGGKTGLLTPGERILINQERGYLLDLQNECPTMRPYTIPTALQQKVQEILKAITYKK